MARREESPGHCSRRVVGLGKAVVHKAILKVEASWCLVSSPAPSFAALDQATVASRNHDITFLLKHFQRKIEF